VYLRAYQYPFRQHYRFKVIGFKGRRPCFVGERAANSEHPFKMDNNLSRSRRVIRDLILCNRFSWFCTFTFDDSKIDRYDLSACKKAITEFFKNFRNRSAPDFIYLVVPERHEDGAWHFHGVVSGIPLDEFSVPETITVRDRKTQKLKVVKNKKHYVRWERYSQRFGFFDCSRIRHYEACAQYISKYITKALADMTKGKRLFFASQNLERPSLIFDEDDVPFPYRPDYEDEWCRLAWVTQNQATGHILPSWYGEQCSELHDPDQKGDRAALESLIFEPLTYEQLKLQYYGGSNEE